LSKRVEIGDLVQLAPEKEGGEHEHVVVLQVHLVEGTKGEGEWTPVLTVLRNMKHEEVSLSRLMGVSPESQKPDLISPEKKANPTKPEDFLKVLQEQFVKTKTDHAAGVSPEDLFAGLWPDGHPPEVTGHNWTKGSPKVKIGRGYPQPKRRRKKKRK